MSEWIKFSEKKPPIYDWVLVCSNNQGTDEPKPISIACWDGMEWIFIDNCTNSKGVYLDIIYSLNSNKVSDWMPLPSPPK